MNIALILAGGVGSRINSSLPKQYIEVNKKPILVYTLEAFNTNPNIDKIFVVSDESYFSLIKEYANRFNITKFVEVFKNGSTRQHSSFLGLQKLKEYNVKDDDIVLIHDACRPLVSEDIITNNIKKALAFGAVNTYIDVKDTIFVSRQKEVLEETLNRNILLGSQTPQSFKYSIILKAHETFKNEEVTDDVQLVTKMNYPVHLVKGNDLNFKVTTSLDLELFKLLISK